MRCRVCAARLGNMRVSLTQSMIMSVPPIAVFVSMYATVRVSVYSVCVSRRARWELILGILSQLVFLNNFYI